MPLKSSHSVKDLGVTEEDAVIVAAPPNEVTSLVNMDAELKDLSVKEKKSEVYFQLVDSVTGLPYKETTSTAVSLSFNATVENFRDAVINKYKDQKANLLTGFASSQLVVYENKEAFDKRNDQEEKVIHLDLIAERAIEILLLCRGSWGE